MTNPPKDWTDRAGWNAYLKDQAERVPTEARFVAGLRYLRFALQHGNRVWFPGCGVDLAPALYACCGCNVLATDISTFGVEWQDNWFASLPANHLVGWQDFLDEAELTESSGAFEARVEDFLSTGPDETFDVIVSRRAFPQLSASDQARAASEFTRRLRPGGQVILDTLNVQGDDRDILEASLKSAGFYVPYAESEGWYRQALKATGIVFAMVLGRPMIPQWGQYPEEEWAESKTRDRARLDALRPEYESRMHEESLAVKERLHDGVTKVAQVIYSTG